MTHPQNRQFMKPTRLAGIALLNCSLAATGNEVCNNSGACSAQPMFDNGSTQRTKDSPAAAINATDGCRAGKLEQQQVAMESLEKSQHFLVENSRKEGVVVLKSGLQYRIINQGNGRKPLATDHITVHYEGRLMDGTLLDSSYRRNQPTTFQLNRVIAGWSEGIQKMPQGSVWELVIPPTLAYGAIGIPGMVGPNEVIIFKVELKDVSQGG